MTETTSTPSTAPRYDWLWLGFIIVFFFKLLTDFVAAVYAFGLLGTDIPPEIVTVIVFFAPVIWLMVRRTPGRWGRLILVGLILLTSAVETFLDTQGQMLVAGLGVGACLMWLPVWFFKRSRTAEANDSSDLGLAVSAGLAYLSVTSARPLDVIVGAYTALALVFAWPILRWARQADRSSQPTEPQPPRFLATTGLVIGLMAALIMLYFAFTSPNVIARWTGMEYSLIFTAIVIALTMFGVGYHRAMGLPRNVILIWNVIFVIALTATLLAYHIDFPTTPSSYPLAEPLVPAWAIVTTLLICLLFPVILVDVSVYSRELIARRPSLRTLGGSFTLAGLFLLLMIFAQVFTTVYDYIPVVGPLFRDRFWLVFAVLGVVMVLPLLRVRSTQQVINGRLSKRETLLILALGVLVVLSVAWPWSKPASMPEQPTKLRVLTYNIQQGYSADGQWNYSGQLMLMRDASADVIGLQESDTNRIAGGNVDLVGYFATRLGFNSYYGPKVGAGTFGIALLSRYPIENPRTVYFYSKGEQTAAILANITAGSKRFQVIVTHLGNDGPIVQQQELLQVLDPNLPVIAMGDFNFRPDTEQYQLTRTKLDDAWMLRWPNGVDDQGRDIHNRIDHIFVSPGTTINAADYLDSPESDHPSLRVEIGW